ncbi:STE3-domain-containing protein [Punctularia strigosozonata HHB-11173 SS5]|uniref:STE3-domain-containing protein n=1 Tax=Punctularia strigosozonata (strain HHB-11173) TaxID=741275 RepID=UPI0004416DA1|nr:STE3-domain-containing protein [Punctularia strigosozonata HHB-11173 SS5]EIN05681.1 STE3-domain-containing protein [Punctularia strigosozonata HHB-11173 SS5]
MSDSTWPLFPVFACLGFVLPLIPLTWHFQAWNSATCYYMIWASLGSLNLFVNSIVWHNNAINWVPVWCDISTRITIGVSVGIPAASLCINRRLYNIACVPSAVVVRAEKQRAVIIDTLICVLLPMIVMVLAYIVTGHRFNIFEDVGCWPALYDTIPTFFLVSAWPILLGLISSVYCVLSLRALIRRQASFSEFISSNKGLSTSRYFRLMALATTEILCNTPLAIYVIVLNARLGVNPWISWSDTHYDQSRVEEIPAVLWRLNHSNVVSLELSRWSVPACAIIFLLFFGFAEEARRHYKLAFWFVAKRLGFKPLVSVQASNGSGSHLISRSGFRSTEKGFTCPPPPKAGYFPAPRSSSEKAPPYSRTSSDVSLLRSDTTEKGLPSSFTSSSFSLDLESGLPAFTTDTINISPPLPAYLLPSTPSFEAIAIDTPTGELSRHSILGHERLPSAS